VQLDQLATEARNPRTTDLDVMPTDELLAVMNAEDQRVAIAVRDALPDVARAVELCVDALGSGGRLVYLGAGTSGRLGLLDAVECPPTFGSDPGQVLALIAGGPQALTGAVEGAEDDPAGAVEDLRRVGLARGDVVVGLAASGRTPYVIAGLDHARGIGAATVAVTCNPGAPAGRHVDVAIEVDTGPEALTGSTRLKAGTAQKLVCNMLSTATMVRLGKTYENLMVDVQPTNAKLVDRARRIVAQATGQDLETAGRTLDAAGGSVKTAIVMLLAGCERSAADDLLVRADGQVRRATAIRARAGGDGTGTAP